MVRVSNVSDSYVLTIWAIQDNLTKYCDLTFSNFIKKKQLQIFVLLSRMFNLCLICAVSLGKVWQFCPLPTLISYISILLVVRNWWHQPSCLLLILVCTPLWRHKFCCRYIVMLCIKHNAAISLVEKLKLVMNSNYKIPQAQNILPQHKKWVICTAWQYYKTDPR